LKPFYDYQRKRDWTEVRKHRRVVEGDSTFLVGEDKVNHTCRLDSLLVQTGVSYNQPSARGTCGGNPPGIARIRANGKVIFADVIHDCVGSSPSEIRYQRTKGWQICFGQDEKRRRNAVRDA